MATTSVDPPAGRLTNAQLEILHMFSEEVPTEVILEMRRVYIRYLDARISTAMDELFEKNGWGDEKIEEWKSTHMRTPYKPQ